MAISLRLSEVKKPQDNVMINLYVHISQFFHLFNSYTTDILFCAQENFNSQLLF